MDNLFRHNKSVLFRFYWYYNPCETYNIGDTDDKSDSVKFDTSLINIWSIKVRARMQNPTIAFKPHLANALQACSQCFILYNKLTF